jgi:hypothetical protein
MNCFEAVDHMAIGRPTRRKEEKRREVCLPLAGGGSNLLPSPTREAVTLTGDRAYTPTNRGPTENTRIVLVALACARLDVFPARYSNKENGTVK